MEIKQKAIKGMWWATVAQFLRLLITFVITTILARLLEPDDFGLVAMVVVFTNFVAILNDIGLPAAIIQKKDLDEEQKSSSFWINLLEGILITLLSIALSPLIARFYSRSQLMPIVMVLSSTFFISSLGMIHLALLAREMNFKKIALLETISVFLAGVMSVVMAILGFGVWSLVFQNVASAVITAALLWIFCGWRPRLICRWKPIKDMFFYGLNLMGFNIINYFSRNLDNLLIGRFIGSLALGVYNLAYRVFLFPLYAISSVVGRVMFPALSSIQDQKVLVREAYIRATRIIALVTFPMAIGLLVAAPQFVRVFFGDKWARATFIIQILALVGLIQSVATTVGWIYQSQGRTDTMFRWSVFATAATTLAFIIGLKWDIEGVAIAYAITNIALIYPAFYIALRLIDLKVHRYFRSLSSIAASAAIMGIAAYSIRFLLERYLGQKDLLIFAIIVTSSIMIYLASTLLFCRDTLKDTLEMLKLLKERQSIP